MLSQSSATLRTLTTHGKSLAGEYPGPPGVGHCDQLDCGEGEENQEVHQVGEEGPRPPCAPAPPSYPEGGVTVRRHNPGNADQSRDREAFLPAGHIFEVTSSNQISCRI